MVVLGGWAFGRPKVQRWPSMASRSSQVLQVQKKSLTESDYTVALQESIPAQIRPLALHIGHNEG